MFCLVLEFRTTKATISIIEMYGKELAYISIKDTKEPIIQMNLHNIASGSYLLKVITEGNTYRQILVIR